MEPPSATGHGPLELLRSLDGWLRPFRPALPPLPCSARGTIPTLGHLQGIDDLVIRGGNRRTGRRDEEHNMNFSIHSAIQCSIQYFLSITQIVYCTSHKPWRYRFLEQFYQEAGFYLLYFVYNLVFRGIVHTPRSLSPHVLQKYSKNLDHKMFVFC